MKFLIVTVHVRCGQTDMTQLRVALCIYFLFVDIKNSALLQTNFIMSTHILSTNFNVLNDPSIFLDRLY